MFTPEMRSDLIVLINHVGTGAHMQIVPLDKQDIETITDLLHHYVRRLQHTDPPKIVEKITHHYSPQGSVSRFVKVIPHI